MNENKMLERFISTEERSKSNTKRLDEHDKSINELKKTYAIMENMNYRMGNVEKSVESINIKLDRQEKEISAESVKDVKKKSELVDYILKGILTILIGYIAIKLGLK